MDHNQILHFKSKSCFGILLFYWKQFNLSFQLTGFVLIYQYHSSDQVLCVYAQHLHCFVINKFYGFRFWYGGIFGASSKCLSVAKKKKKKKSFLLFSLLSFNCYSIYSSSETFLPIYRWVVFTFLVEMILFSGHIS